MATSSSHSTGAIVSAVSALLFIAAMQVFRSQLASSQAMTIVGGFLGADVFVFVLTAISNAEMYALGDNFKAGLVPEVAVSMLIAVVSSAAVHRVCASTCVIFSLLLLYAINNISIGRYAPAGAAVVGLKKKK